MSSNGKLPWFAFYHADWLSDDVVRSMNPLARSAYIDLLCYAARNHPIGTLKPGYNLWRLSGLSEVEFEQEKDSILAPFKLIDGLLVQKRMYDDGIERERKRLALSESGKKGMSSRWSKKGKNNHVITTLLRHDNLQSQSQNKEKKATLSKEPLSKEQLIAKLQAIYPAVEVKSEFCHASAWILTHPDRKFTQRFFSDWVKRESKRTDDALLPLTPVNGSNGNGNGHHPAWIPPTIEAVIKHAESRRLAGSYGRHCWKHWTGNNWKHFGETIKSEEQWKCLIDTRAIPFDP